jgi:peptide/nickel transport system ATP-binding protein
MSTLEVQGLGKRFAMGGIGFRREVLDAVADVSFTLRPGHVTALVGESGSGRPTGRSSSKARTSATSGGARRCSRIARTCR